MADLKAPRPPLSFMLSKPAHLLSLGLGSGLSPWAPGTVGSLLAWALFYPLHLTMSHLGLGQWGFGLFLLLALVCGIRAVDRTGRELGVVDHGSIVWDEFVAVWLVLWLCPASLAWQAAGVALFRLFDITKPPPIRQLEQRYKNAFGVMLDDLLAAGISLFLLALAWKMFV